MINQSDYEDVDETNLNPYQKIRFNENVFESREKLKKPRYLVA
jgi:hypothetical protein